MNLSGSNEAAHSAEKIFAAKEIHCGEATIKNPFQSRTIAAALALWLLLALLASASGALSILPVPFPQVVLFLLTATLLLLSWKLLPLRLWLASIDERILLLPHFTRFVGFYFLYLYSLGKLPYAFAVIGGRGDIIAATAAIPLLFITPTSIINHRVWIIWNAFGLIDILFVVATAARFGFTQPNSMQPLLGLPLGLLPTLIVPLIIASHIILFVRLLGRAK